MHWLKIDGIVGPAAIVGLWLMVAAIVIPCALPGPANASEQKSEFIEVIRALGFNDWISIEHLGPEDKPVEAFAVAFTTGTLWVRADYRRRPLKIIVLPEKVRPSLVDFLAAIESSSATPTHESGSFRALVFAPGAPAEAFFMNAAQSLRFFEQLASVVKQQKGLGKKDKSSVDQMIRFLSRIQK